MALVEIARREDYEARREEEHDERRENIVSTKSVDICMMPSSLIREFRRLRRKMPGAAHDRLFLDQRVRVDVVARQQGLVAFELVIETFGGIALAEMRLVGQRDEGA